jgi:transcriptional regulator with XRE-family HTH domain
MVTIAEKPGLSRHANHRRVGPLLRDWRQRRRMSQMELALEAGVSTRHLSFVETGRSRPSAEMVLHLAERLEVPLRERNELLLAAGFAPQYSARDFDDPALREVRDAVGRVLAAHEPYPAIAVDRYWNLIASNEALGPFLEGVAPELLVPPVNTIRLALHPDGVAPRILNLGEYRADLVERLERAARLTGDPELAALHEEMLGYPGPEAPAPPAGASSAAAVAVGLRLAPAPGSDAPELSFFSTITTFGTAVDVTVSELAVEAFFPADAQTAEYLRR